jgi:hypothetical protein
LVVKPLFEIPHQGVVQWASLAPAVQGILTGAEEPVEIDDMGM